MMSRGVQVTFTYEAEHSIMHLGRPKPYRRSPIWKSSGSEIFMWHSFRGTEIQKSEWIRSFGLCRYSNRFLNLMNAAKLHPVAILDTYLMHKLFSLRIRAILTQIIDIVCTDSFVSTMSSDIKREYCVRLVTLNYR